MEQPHTTKQSGLSQKHSGTQRKNLPIEPPKATPTIKKTSPANKLPMRPPFPTIQQAENTDPPLELQPNDTNFSQLTTPVAGASRHRHHRYTSQGILMPSFGG
jgi:hypothetical protein